MSSPARTVYILPPSPGGVGPNGSIRSNTQLVWPSKTPGDTEDFTIDASAFLGSDTINPSSVTIASVIPSDLTYSAPTITSATITWTFSGGTVTSPPTEYVLNVNFSTTAGLTVSRQVFLPIMPAAGPPGIGAVVQVQGPAGVGSSGPQGVGIASVTQPSGPGSAVVTLSNGSTYALTFAPGVQGVQGVGISGVTQPNGPNTAVFSLLDPSTGIITQQTVPLPPGPQGAAPILVFGQPAALPPGSAPTVTATQTAPGVYSLVLGIATGNTGSAGPAGASIVGPTGATSSGGIPAGIWTPNTSPVLAAGGLVSGSAAPAFAQYTVGGSVGSTTTITPFDGVPANVVQGDLVTNSGGAWSYSQRQTNGAFQSVQVGAATVILDNGDASGNTYIVDAQNQIGLQISSTGVGVGTLLANSATIAGILSAGSLNVAAFAPANVSTAGSISAGSNLIAYDSGDGNAATAIIDSQGYAGLIVSAAGVATGPLSINGNLVVNGSISSTGTGSSGAFSSADINAAETQTDAQNAADRVPPSGTMPAASNYNLMFSMGPSESLGFEAVPALPGPAWPSGNDVQTIGLGSRGRYWSSTNSNRGTWAGVQDNLFHAATPIAQAAASGLVETIPTGAVTITNATVALVSSGTISITGTCTPALNAVFQAGNAFFGSNFATATANNFNAPGVTNDNNYFTVLSAGSNSITASVGSTYAVTGSPEASIVLSQYAVAGTGGTGEDPLMTAAFDFAALRLSSVGLVTDPAHKIVPVNCGVGNQQIGAFIPTATPNLFNTAVGAANAAISAAGTATCSALALMLPFGGPDYSAGNTKATIKTNVLAVVDAFVAQIETGVFGQPLTAIKGLNVYGGPASADFDSTGTDPLPVANAIADLCGMAPSRGFTSPARKGMFCFGLNTGINHSQHNDSNGAVAYGAQMGKAAWLFSKYGYKPPYVEQPLIRGNQILIPIGGLIGKLIAPDVFSYGLLVLPSTLGLSVTDSTVPITLKSGSYGFYGGGLAITSAAIVGPSTALVTLAATPTGSNLLLWCGDSSVHGGLSGLADSDPHTSTRTHYWSVGSGQSPFNNLPGPVGLTQPVSNGQYITTRQAVVPCAVPIIAG